MSRAALGHSGRPLVVARPIVLAYLLIALAALIRGFGSGLPGLYWPAVLTAGAFWTAGFGCFVAVYLPILAAPPASEPS